MQKSTSTAVALLSALAGFLAPLPLFAQTTITFDDGLDYTDVRTTTVANPLTLTIAGGAATQSGLIDGDGSLTKTGAGSITLTATNTYTGGTIVNEGILAIDNDGATTFGTLGSGTTTVNGDSGSGLTGTLQFLANASAGSGAFTVTGGSTNGGYGGGVEFHGTSSAGTGTFTADGATASGASGGGVAFFGASTAGSATLIANGSATSGAGGSIYFVDDSLGDAATVKVYGNGFLDIGFHNAGVTIGSLEGTGQVFLGANNLTIGSNNTDTAFSGTVQDGSFASGGSLTKTGTGTLILSGTNTYTGGTTITGGTLQLGDGGTTGSVTGNIVNDGALVFNRSDALIYADLISGTGSLTQAGTGTLTLSGDNTYTGGTTITAGTLQLGDGGTTGSVIGDISNNAALVFNRSDALTYAGVVSGSGSLTQAGGNTLTLSGLNTYTGATRVTAGTLALADDNRLSASTTLYLTGGNLDLGGHAQTFAGLGSSSSGLVGNITAGAITTNGDTYLTSGTYANTWAGTGRLLIGGSSSTVNLNGTNDSVTADHNQVIIGSSATGAAGLVRLGNANALAAASENVHLWAGVLNLNGQTNVRANSLVIENGDTSALVNLTTASTASFAGGVTLVTGTTQIGGSGNLALSGTVSGAGGFSKTSSGTLTLSGDNTYTGNTDILAGALVISGTLGSGDYHGTIANSGALTLSAPSADQTLAGVISGTGSLTKSGTGTLTLGATNTYTGDTTIGGGTLAVTGSLGAGAYSGAMANSGTLALASSANQTLSGVISGTGSLTKSGTGTLTLTATNTYAGGTVLNGGTLGLGADNALGSGLLTINGGNIRSVGNERTLTNDVTLNGDFTLGRLTNLSGAIALTNDVTLTSANLDTSGPASSTLSGVISGAHSLTFTEGTNPTGTIVLTGTNTYTGGTTLNAGTLQIGNGGTTGSIVGDIVDNASLIFNRSDATTYAGVISGTGSVAHTGSGTLTLTGTNTYEGGTTVSSGGLLEFTTDANLGTGNITLDYGALKWATGNTTDVSARLNSIGSGGTALYYWVPEGTFNTNGNDVVFNTPVTGVSGAILQKTGTGTLTLNGGTTSSIDYYVAGGTLTFATGTYDGVSIVVGDGSAMDPLLSAVPSAAVITGAGTSVSMTNGFYVGNYNALSAALTISGGASVTDLSYESQIGVGSTAGAESTLSVTGAGSTYTAVGVLTIGIANHGQTAVVIADGGSVTTQETLLGTSSQAPNLVTVSGAGSLFTTNGKLTIGGGYSRGSSFTISDGASASATTTLIGENTYYGGANSLTLTGTGSTFTNTGSLTLAVSALDKGTLNLGSAAGDAATAAGILDTDTVTGGLGTAVLQFNTTGTDLAPTYFTRDGTSTGTGVNTTGGLSIINTAGTTVLSGTGTQTGVTRINGGTLVATQLANGGSASSIGQSTNAATNLVLNGGALRYTGAAQSTDRLFQVGDTTAGATGTLDASGTGALNFTNTGSITYGTADQTRTLALTGTNTGANTLAALIADNGTAAVRVAKTGAGTWALTGTNTYTGGTTITAGQLTLGSAAALGTGSVSVASGAVLDASSYGFDLNRLSGAGTITASGSYTDSSASDVTLATNLTGTASLAKTGTGTLTLTGTNTYEGGTSISGWGTLEFSSGTNLGTGNITLDGGILKWAAGTTTDISSRINTLNENGGAFDTNGNNVTFASAIAGSPAYSQFVKLGAGTLTLSGATVTEFFIGGGTLDLGTGAYQGNDLLIGGNFGLDADGYGPTAVILSGAGTSFSIGGDAYIGYTNEFSASLTLSGGASFSSPGSATTYVGYDSTAESTLTVTGAGSTYTNSGYLEIGTGSSGRSSFIVADGASASAGTTVIGNYGATGANSLTLTGAGSTFTTGSLTLAVSATSNGTLNLGSAAGAAATAAGILDTATVTGGLGAAVLQFNTTGTALAPTYFTRDGTSTGTGVNTTGGLSLVNTAGTTVLSGTLAHTGATWVNGGTLRVNGSLTASAVTVASGATLGGSGTIGGLATFESGAHLAPGNSPGTLTFTGGLTLSTGSILDFQLGTTSDLIVVSGGTLTGPSSGTITVNLTDSGGFTAGTYTLIDATGATLTSIGATSLDLGATIEGYTYTFAQNGNLFQLIATASAVPEPSTCAALFGAVTLAFVVIRRRSRA